MPDTIDMRPAASLVRASLAHCKIGLTYNDDHTVEMPEDTEDTITLLSNIITLAMEKHLEDTLILPTNVARIREVRDFLDEIANAGSLAQDFGSLSELKERAEEAASSLTGVARNLDPAER